MEMRSTVLKANYKSTATTSPASPTKSQASATPSKAKETTFRETLETTQATQAGMSKTTIHKHHPIMEDSTKKTRTTMIEMIEEEEWVAFGDCLC
jgi:hypothetical protein